MLALGRAPAIVVSVLLLVGLAPVAAIGQSDMGSGSSAGVASQLSKHVPDELLVRFARGVSPTRRPAIHAGLGAKTAARYPIVDGLELVKLPKGTDMKRAIKFYRQHPEVLYAEPNYVVEALVSPNDTWFNQLWGLQNTGQNGGVPGADIEATQAWTLTTGSSGVVVAVIDTGIDYTHPDLADNMFHNTADCNANGVDDDLNGFVDDCYGIDTTNNDTNPMDDNKHGTHVSGTIGAVGNNALGVVGVNWDVQLMGCKFLNANGSGSDAGAIACLNYVAMMKDRGVNIVATNNSWGGGAFAQALHDAIDAHRQRGILFIAAAGNAGSNNDASLFYPASDFLPNVISVAATTETDALASFSNYGRHTVHIGAPGTSIFSTMPGNSYGYLGGTSMATPHVTGVAALLKAQDPTRDWRAIRNLILSGGDDDPALANTITQKRLNAYGALTCSNSTVLSRLEPVGSTITAAVGAPTDLAALHINCADPAGDVAVTVATGGTTIATVVLKDDGIAPDQAAGDGTYTGQWIPPAVGTYTLTFPGGDTVTVVALSAYDYSPTAFAWRTIAGTTLDLSDDSYAPLSLPFPIPFGGGSFSTLWVGSNGYVSFAGPLSTPTNDHIPTPRISTLVSAFWDDLYPVPGTTHNVYWAVTGAAPNRELVIEWRHVMQWECNADTSATVDFQMVFFESSGDILFNYADPDFGGACAFADNAGAATIGVQVASNQGHEFSFNSPSVSAGSALLWTMATPSPVMRVIEPSLDFGGVLVGTSKDLSLTVQNTGGGTLTGSASTAAPYSIVSGGSFSLGPGASQPVVVRFSPTVTGSAPGAVAFTSSAGNISRTVSGTGDTLPVITVTPSSLSFGTVAIANSADLSFTVRNTGGGTLTGSASTAAPYSIVSGGSFSLVAGASQAVVVRFTPTATGSAPGAVAFTSSAGNVSRTVSGTGGAPPVMSVTPSSLSFGTAAIGNSVDLSFTVQNTGGGTLTGSASTAAPYSIVSGGSFSVSAGASQAVVVRFTPTATGSATGTVAFTSNGGNASGTVSGTGGPPPVMSVTPASQSFGMVAVGSSKDLTFTVQNVGGGTLTGSASTVAPYSIVSGGSYSLGSFASQAVVVRFTPTATGSATGTVTFPSSAGTLLRGVSGTGDTSSPVIAVTPASLSFGTVTVGSSADLSFTVQNTGGGTLTGSASIAAPYSIVSGGSYSLVAGASQAVVVRFTPTAAGSAPGAVAFTSNGGNLSRTVSGTGGTAPAITVTPASLSFGTVLVGSSKDLSFTVQNTGGGTLTGSASTSAPFSIVSSGSFTLGPGASQSVSVRFAPSAPGGVSGTVVFISNGGNVSSPVTGAGATGTISVTSPKGGESWRVNNNKTIKWNYTGVISTVRIDLSRDGGATWETLFSSAVNDKSQAWKVTGPATSQARVRICDLTMVVCGASAANFTIR
jgi:subtilisin family serine protease